MIDSVDENSQGGFRVAVGENREDHILRQYELYVQTAQDVSEWRNSSNKFFVATNAIIFTLYGGIASWEQQPEGLSFVLPLIGLVVGFAWLSLIQSYRKLNKAKFEVILELEKELPVPLFTKEWEILNVGYNPLTSVERVIPVVFIGLYFVILVIHWLKI